MLLHRRIARVQDSAGDTTHLSVFVVEHEHWRCAVCLHDNESDEWDRCGFCNRERGDWLCEPCGHRNKKGAKDCEECGTPRPEDYDG